MYTVKSDSPCFSIFEKTQTLKTTLLFLSVFLSASLFGQNVYIPDANFKANLVGNSQINTNTDTEIQVSEASSFSGTIYCMSANIADLTGIEAFTSLTELNCGYNQLTSLDVSQNIGLTTLYCGNNQLIVLDVSQNIGLTILGCPTNHLTSLDISQNLALVSLGCGGNLLTTIDVSQNTALTWFNCAYNDLISLDVSQNIGLTELHCSGNQLTDLDVSQNTALEVLYVHFNPLTNIDVSQNLDLTYLNCGNNQLTGLDVSQNTQLIYLLCQNTEISCLNAANGNNVNMTFFVAHSNPNLTCIEVDNAAWSTANWTDIDAQTSFSEDCNNDCSTSTAGLNELTTSKNLIQILDLMGRETAFKPNIPLIYVYDDGSTEKVFSVEY